MVVRWKQVGLDAEVAYRFHSLREKRPWLSPTRCAQARPPTPPAHLRPPAASRMPPVDLQTK